MRLDNTGGSEWIAARTAFLERRASGNPPTTRASFPRRGCWRTTQTRIPDLLDIQGAKTNNQGHRHVVRRRAAAVGAACQTTPEGARKARLTLADSRKIANESQPAQFWLGKMP